MQPLKGLLSALPAVALLSLCAQATPLGSHSWDWTEAFSNADGTIQFIELRECCGGANEGGVPGHAVSSNSTSFVLPGAPLIPPTTNKHYLIATQAFANLPGAPAPDAIIPAGSTPFFSAAGDSITYMPWDTWNFGAVPTDGINSLKRSGAVSANDPTNYAGMTGSVDASPSTSFCDDADGSLASCPCAPGLPDTGCDIQQGTGGVLLSIIQQNTSPSNAVTAAGSGFPPASTPASIVIRGTTIDAGSPVVFGDGLRCVGAPVVRLGATFASGGSSTHTFGHGAMAGSGDFYYQLWFRNIPIMYCDPSAAFNLSNGQTLNW
jgi:hypothetical protein